MDRAMLESHLARAEAHVSEGERILERQRRVVSELEQHGLDTELAEHMLGLFEESQAEHVAHRERLRAALGASR